MKRIRKTVSFWMLMLTGGILLFGSCNKPKVSCFSYQRPPKGGWEQHYELTFPIDTIRQGGNYHLALLLRTTARYPFQSLWLQVRTEWQNPYSCRTDTLRCQLTDKQGRPLGQGMQLRQTAHLLWQGCVGEGRWGTVTVCHIMRRGILPGVPEVGVWLGQGLPPSAFGKESRRFRSWAKSEEYFLAP